jgi:protoporphyrinogen oxidase
MKTAVEWLVNQMKQRESQGLTLSMYELEMFAEQAKEMEKEQIIDTWNNAINAVEKDKWESFEQYYNETFKSE